ncbi:DUF2157 domain-containing protein [Flavobacterium sp.]
MNKISELLLSRNFISKEQHQAVIEYQKLELFSIRNELLFLLYISILLFTTGVGIIIYKNINTIGHTILLVLLAVLTATSFYFCYKKAKVFSKKEVSFDNPLYDYLVLFTTILLCTLIGYFQYNLNIQNSNYSLATLFSGIVALGMAYYFDNKSALVVGITALGSFIGLSLKIQTIFENNMFSDNSLLVAGISFGALLLAWQWYSERSRLKIHFSFVLLTFALHLMTISSLAGSFQDGYWFLYIIVLGGILYYYYQNSINFNAVSWYVFVLFYGYIGFNILLFRIINTLKLDEIFEFVAFMSPFYVIGCIVLFIKLIKNFKRKTNVSK